MSIVTKKKITAAKLVVACAVAAVVGIGGAPVASALRDLPSIN